LTAAGAGAGSSSGALASDPALQDPIQLVRGLVDGCVEVHGLGLHRHCVDAGTFDAAYLEAPEWVETRAGALASIRDGEAAACMQ